MARIRDETVVLVPDPGKLCSLSHSALTGYETLGLVALPKGYSQEFPEAPGLILAAGGEDAWWTETCPVMIEFDGVEGRKGGVAFKFKQAPNGQAYVGYIEADQLRPGPKYADIDNLRWWPLAAIASFSDVENKTGFPILTHVKEAIKQKNSLHALGVKELKDIGTSCAPGNFGKNARIAWAQSELAARAQSMGSLTQFLM